jgi:hypothetical protein
MLISFLGDKSVELLEPREIVGHTLRYLGLQVSALL